MGKRKPRDAADEADGLDEETRLARAVEKAREATKRRNASLFAESALPGAGRRPEANYGDRWEVEEALATVAGGAEVAATLGMAHPDLEPRSAGDPSVDPAAVPDADLDPAERGYHDPEPGELWVKTLDLESGEPYYFNPRTRETTWDEPPPSSRVQIDERVAEAEADARATTPTTRETNEENDENEAAAADDDAAPDGTAPEPSPATATQTQHETLHPKRHARRKTTADVERLWAMEDARAAEPASAEARFGEGTAGVWAARAAAAAAAAAAAETETSARIDTNPATRTGTAVASNSEWASAVEEGLARANTGADAGSEPTANADALPDDADPSVESEPRWLYLDDTGAWQGPFPRAQLRAWRAMLPATLRTSNRRRNRRGRRRRSRACWVTAIWRHARRLWVRRFLRGRRRRTPSAPSPTQSRREGLRIRRRLDGLRKRRVRKYRLHYRLPRRRRRRRDPSSPVWTRPRFPSPPPTPRISRARTPRTSPRPPDARRTPIRTPIRTPSPGR